MPDFNKYVGVPYLEHGRDFNGCDCFGLVRLALARELRIYLPDWRPESHEPQGRFKAIESHIDSFKRVDLPEVGDIGIFVFESLPTHVGLYVGNGLLLHTLQGRQACIERLSSPLLRGRAREWYRYSTDSN